MTLIEYVLAYFLIAIIVWLATGVVHSFNCEFEYAVISGLIWPLQLARGLYRLLKVWWNG